MRQTDKQSYSGWILPSLVLLLVGIVAGCAHIVPPGGGPYDETPPRLIRSQPGDRALDVKNKKVVLYFDEYVKLEDVANKVIISPPQLAQPKISAIGKSVVVELEDDLIPNTTYSLDFTDGIVDNNEGNPLENFSYAFSTGGEIDTMEISGMVLNARNLEPTQGIVVGIHPESGGREAFVDTTFLRMSRTSDRARFIMRNIKSGRYRVFALKESDGNYRHDMATEGVAYLDSLITTRSTPATRMDTLWVDSLTVDTIKEVKYIRYMPDDLVLRYFEPVTDKRHIAKRERVDSLQLKLTFNAALLSPLSIRPVDSLSTPSSMQQPYVLDSDESGVVHVFFRDPSWGSYSQFEVQYASIDSLNQPMMVVDTLQLRTKAPQKAEPRATGEGEDGEEKKEASPFTVRVEHRGDGGVGDSILFITSLPIDSTALKGIELYNANDSILVPLKWERVAMLPGRSTMGYLVGKLNYDTSYEIYFDSLLFTDVYGHHLDKTVVDAFKTKAKDEFAHFQVDIHGIEGPFIAELLNLQDQPIRVAYSDGNTVRFRDLKPEKYALRIIQDKNGNRKWDSGDYKSDTQPEWVYYSPKIFELMKNWEVKENFAPLATPLEQQKPRDLIKNKPKEKKKRNLNQEREEEMRQRREGNFGTGGNTGMGGFGGLGNRGMGGGLRGMQR